MAGRNAGRNASNIGMMEGAFFVSRTELLSWANNLLQTSLTKVEQCASGAVYCQIIDACHPTTIAMKKVNWMAKADHEFLPNYKVLQAAFDKNGIQRHIDVDKLIRAKYQDNLEFLQFMKCYWEHEGGCDYDPIPAREGKLMPVWAQSGGAISEPPRPGGAVGGKENSRPRPGAKPAEAEVGKRPAASSRPTTPGAAAALPRTPLGSAAAPARRAQAPAQASGSGAGASELEALRSKAAAQETELEELRTVVEGLEHERDYYFRKLREVEIMATNMQSQLDGDEVPEFTHKKILTNIQDILYAEDDTEEPAEQASPEDAA